MKNIFKVLRNRINFFLNKKKKYKTEDEFYEFLFTKHPGWNSNMPNEDESIRWKEIKEVLDAQFKTGRNIEILEIGCGRGWMANMLTNYGTVTAIEPVKGVIEYAKHMFPHINFYQGTLPEFILNHSQKKFDLVISSEVIEHITNKSLFIKNIYEVLHPSGKTILTTPRMEHFSDFKEAFGSDPNQPVEAWLTETELMELFKQNNFNVILKRFFAPLPLRNKEVFITQLWVAQKK